MLGRRAAVVHAALRPQREVGRGQDRRVDLVAAGAAATAADHVGELVEAERHGHVGPAGADGPGRLAEGHEPGGRRVLDVRDRQPGQPELLHGLDAEHGGGLDVAHEGLVDVGERHVGIVQGEEAGVAGQVRAGDVLVHAEADHADAGDGHAVELQAVAAHAAPRRRGVVGGAEAVDHDVVAVLVLAQRLEVDLDLRADGEVVPAAREDRLHPWSLGQVDLGHPVAGDVGVLLAEHRHVAVGPGVDGAPGRELDVLGALVQALGADQAAGEEDLAAGRAAAAEEARLLRRVVGNPEEPFFDGDSGHALLASPLRSRSTAGESGTAPSGRHSSVRQRHELLGSGT